MVTASSSASWLKVDTPTQSAAPYSQPYEVEANATSAARTATISVKDQTVTVTQAAPTPCPTSPTSVSPSSATVAYGGGTQDVSVTGRSDCTWAASGDRNWLSVSPATVAGGGTVTITATANDGAARSGTVTIGGTGTVSVSQDASPIRCVYSVSPTAVNADAGGSSGTLTVSAYWQNWPPEAGPAPDCPWTATPSDNWITLGTPSGATVTYTVGANTTSAERTGTIDVMDQTVTVTQPAPCPTSPTSVSPTDVSAGSDAGTTPVQVNGRSDCTWAVSETSDWLSASPATVAGGGTVTITVTANTGDARSGTVTIGGESVPVSQPGPCPTAPASLSPASVSAGNGAGTTPVTVNGRSDCTWTVSETSDWISTSPATVAGGGTVTITVTANSGAARSGTVTVGSESILVSQPPPCPASPVGARPPEVRVDGAGAAYYSVAIDGQSGCSWTVSDDQTWITPLASTVKAGASFGLRIPSNNGAAREGTLTVGGLGIPVRQTATGCSFSPDSVTPQTVDIGSGGGTGSVSVTGSSSCSWDVSDDRDWITPKASSVSGGGTVQFDVGSNDGAARSGTVTIGTTSVTVTQAATPCPASPAAVSPLALIPGSDAGTRDVSVKGRSDCTWTASDDQDWITTPASVSGGSLLTVTVTAHTGTAARTGTVTVGGVSVSVTQAAPTENVCDYFVTPGAVNVNSSANSGTLTVAASWRSWPDELGTPPPCLWVAASPNEWITVGTPSGNTVGYTLTANDSSTARHGAIVVAGHTVGVTQAAKGAACASAPDGVNPSSVLAARTSRQYHLSVQGRIDCTWQVRTGADDTWLTASQLSVSGGGTVSLQVNENTGERRFGTVHVGATSVDVTQDGLLQGCVRSVTPASVNAAAGGAKGTLQVSVRVLDVPPELGVPVECPWFASTPQDDWIRLDPPADSSVGYTIDPNDTDTARSGNIIVGNQTVGVDQEAADDPPACPGAPDGVTPSHPKVGRAGGQVELKVDGKSTCSWNVTAQSDWLAANSSSVAGKGSVILTVEPNPRHERSADISIGKRNVRVLQQLNNPPVADAGPSLVVAPGTVVQLDGSGSSSGDDDDVLVFSWKQTDTALAVTLSNADTATATFTAPTVTDDTVLTFSLTVVDQGTASDTDTVSVTVSPDPPNQIPNANAGPDQTAAVGAEVTLDGTASWDADGDTLIYRWSQLSGGPRVTLDRTEPAEPKFFAPAVGADTALTFELTVAEQQPEGRTSLSDTDDVTVTVLGKAGLDTNRDRLIDEWVRYRKRDETACYAYRLLDPTAKQVFIWNTHRLQISESGINHSSMLDQTTALYSVTGKKADGCDGLGYNRTYMAMTPALNEKLTAMYRGDATVVRGWNKSGDWACLPFFSWFSPTECPHSPYTAQIETRSGNPRDQIQFFERTNKVSGQKLLQRGKRRGYILWKRIHYHRS